MYCRCGFAMKYTSTIDGHEFDESNDEMMSEAISHVPRGSNGHQSVHSSLDGPSRGLGRPGRPWELRFGVGTGLARALVIQPKSLSSVEPSSSTARRSKQGRIFRADGGMEALSTRGFVRAFVPTHPKAWALARCDGKWMDGHKGRATAEAEAWACQMGSSEDSMRPRASGLTIVERVKGVGN